ncbi:MAG: GNAT family N-acetyltransferase [Lachnospiraceae bacterium]|nr:GNAT family N-acetyltransferase [Lachnospiraceae bacterium]
MDIRSGYQNDEKLGKSLEDLAGSVFGADIKYRIWGRYRQDEYIPYSVIENDEVVSNVCLNVCNIRWRGSIRHLAMLDCIMTRPGHRNMGYMRELMKKVTDVCDRSFEGTFLYADRSMSGFCEKFSYHVRDEWQYSKEVNITSKQNIQKISLDSPEERGRIVDIMRRPEQYGDKIMVNNMDLFMDRLTGEFSDSIYYLPETGSYTVARIDAGELKLYAVFSDTKVSLSDVIKSFGGDIRSVVLAFSPENNTGFECRRREDDKNVLFTRGEIFEKTKNEKFMFPAIITA